MNDACWPRWRNDLQCRGLKKSADVKTFAKVRCLLSPSDCVGAREAHCQISLARVYLSIHVCNKPHKRNRITHTVGITGIDCKLFILKWIHCAGERHPAGTFPRRQGKNRTAESVFWTVFIQPLWVEVSNRHYSEWFATTSHSWLYFFQSWGHFLWGNFFYLTCF